MSPRQVGVRTWQGGEKGEERKSAGPGWRAQGFKRARTYSRGNARRQKAPRHRHTGRLGQEAALLGRHRLSYRSRGPKNRQGIHVKTGRFPPAVALPSTPGAGLALRNGPNF